ncbi:unnamed protein product, partial [Ranitomeya imitator]
RHTCPVWITAAEVLLSDIITRLLWCVFFAGHAWRDIFNMSKCQPRWVLLNLLNEFPQFSDFLFKPPCVSVLRCAGCCLDEAQSCFPLQSHIIKMEVQVHKSKSFPELTEISVIQHSECECRPHANITVQASRKILMDELRRVIVRSAKSGANNSRISSISGDKKGKKRRRKGKRGKGASKNTRSACLPCRPRRTLNPKNCKCVCEITEEQCNHRGRTLNRERCRLILSDNTRVTSQEADSHPANRESNVSMVYYAEPDSVSVFDTMLSPSSEQDPEYLKSGDVTELLMSPGLVLRSGTKSGCRQSLWASE